MIQTSIIALNYLFLNFFYIRIIHISHMHKNLVFINVQQYTYIHTFINIYVRSNRKQIKLAYIIFKLRCWNLTRFKYMNYEFLTI